MLEGFANWLRTQFVDLTTWFAEVLQTVVDFFVEFFEWLGLFFWNGMLDGLASVVEAIPAPGFLLNAGTYFGNIPGTIVYFFQFFAIAEGLAMITTALTLRFILRRIPFIG